MHRATNPWLVACVVALLIPSAAGAQAPGANDPDPGSPSGVVYEIPVEQGRGDAAPRHTPASGGSGEALSPASGAVSPIRSENGFGSSSRVPGTSEAGAETAAGPGSANRTERERTAEPEDPAGGPGEAQIPPGAAVRATAGGSPSLLRAAVLIGLSVLVAAALGIAARRRD